MAVKTRKKPAKARGGRPSQARAEKIRDEILDIATRLFFQHGYGTTSIEQVARQAGMSKRTFYHRFADKSELFAAVVERLVSRLRPKESAPLFTGGTLEEMLQRIASLVLRSALLPDSVALHRLVLTEAYRFPELANIIEVQGARHEAIERIGRLLASHPDVRRMDHAASVFAAEQFLQLITAAPLRRAMGLGATMKDAELDRWTQDAVALFLTGVRA